VPYLPPLTPIERLLAGVWSELLQVGSVGLQDSFFDLGGTSLTAAMLAARLRSVLDVEMDLRSFFESPTVASLARTLLAELAGRLPREELEALLRRSTGPQR
jgi:acyl carrier protein